jgi:transcriptional regulator
MHPNKAFIWQDEPELYQFIKDTVFAHIFANTDEGPVVAHVPVTVNADGKISFHLAKPNRLVKHLDGQHILLSMTGANGYHSADWYAGTDNVPTWLYQAAEIEGTARKLDRHELVAQVDALSAQMETRLLPKRPWTRAKMPEGKFESMLPFIVGFEVTVSALRGTLKMNQHKGSADVDAMIAGHHSAGRTDIVTLIKAAVAARKG